MVVDHMPLPLPAGVVRAEGPYYYMVGWGAPTILRSSNSTYWRGGVVMVNQLAMP